MQSRPIEGREKGRVDVSWKGRPLGGRSQMLLTIKEA